MTILIKDLIHYFLHFIFPVVIAVLFYRKQWLKSYLLLLATMLVDLDHLLTDPVFVPCRCSIQFHPLHTWPAMIVYGLLLFHPGLRIIGIGLLLHMATDSLDCFLSLRFCP